MLETDICTLVSERANQSIQQLSSALEQLNPDGEEVEEVRGSDGSLLSTMAEEDKAAWSQKTQSEAGDSVIRCGMAVSHLVVRHLEISLCRILMIDSTQSYNKMLLMFVYMLVLVAFGAEVNQLKSLLLKQCKEIPAPLSPSRKQSPSKVEYAALHFYIIICHAAVSVVNCGIT